MYVGPAFAPWMTNVLEDRTDHDGATEPSSRSKDEGKAKDDTDDDMDQDIAPEPILRSTDDDMDLDIAPQSSFRSKGRRKT